MFDILILQKNIQKELKKLTKKKNAEKLDYDEIEFPVQEKDFNKIEVKNNICINVFGYENRFVFPIYISDQKFKDSIDLLLLIHNDKSHYVYSKDFDRFMFHKTKNKNKKWFCKSYLQCFSNENVLIKHKENCLSINGKQSVKLEKRIINKYQFLLKFMLILSVIEKVLNIMKLFVLMIDLLSQLLFIEVKMQLMNLLKQFLRNINIAKK